MKKRIATFLILLLLIVLLILWWLSQKQQPTPPIPIPEPKDPIGDVSPDKDKPEPPKPPEPIKPKTFFDKLSDAAIERTMHSVVYDPKYVAIDYPMGDVPPDTGVCTDVVIRAYRKFGIDLQELVHEDISKRFKEYPAIKKWGSKKPDSNIDHRRVYNLQAFFEEHGESLPITDDAKNYQPGDLVTWQITPKFPHIGIVVDVASFDPDRYMIVHNIGSGPQIDDILFAYPITGHYRFSDEMALANRSKEKKKNN